MEAAHLRLIPELTEWDSMRARFKWPRPAHYNIAEMTCERWARVDPNRRAMTYLRPDGEIRDYTFIQLSRASSRLANALKEHGLRRGDRCAVLLPQTPETLLTHLACYKIGAIVVPLFTLFGEEGLKYRLFDSGAKALVTDVANLEKVLNIRDDLPALEMIYSIDQREGGTRGFWQELGKAADFCPMADTIPEDPAFISYTSGTTGPPKGALHGHKVLMGHLPAFETHHEFGPWEGDCFWTPADWAWMGGLTNLLLPTLNYGLPVIAHRMAKFDPEHADWMMERLGVRNAFLPPTALKLMRKVGAGGRAKLRSVGSAGEALGAELLDWGRDVLGVNINEFYGQTECNPVLGNSGMVMEARAGSTGKPIPGYDVVILGPDEQILPPGEVGEIAVRAPNPSLFLRYWNQPEKTAAKFRGEWMLTGDEAWVDEDGYFHFSSRVDDVITSSGYRIGPTEIEDCLSGHPAVAMAGVVGIPDPVRTEIVKAFVVLRDDFLREGLDRELIKHVRDRLSPHAAPREIEFIDSLPMTATGKIMRRILKQKG